MSILGMLRVLLLGALATGAGAVQLLAIGEDAQLPTTMRAVVSTGAAPHGDFSKVKVLTDRPVPQPGPGQVLIKVAASSVNPVDWKLLSGPLALIGPQVLGFDVAGTVVELGEGCSRLKLGDAVWADLGKAAQRGAWAEFALADESQVGLKPVRLDFAAAASLPLAALTTLQALRMVGYPWKRSNLSVVVTSGAAGTGLPALQMAKACNASRVVTAASPANAALLERYGATEVVDYHSTSIWDELPEDSVDVVYDNYGAPGTADAAMKVLRPGGVFIFLPGMDGQLSKNPKPGVQQINYGYCDSSKHEDLDELRALADAGQLDGVVDKSFALEDIVGALEMSIAGHVVGKVGINIAPAAAEESLVY